ncbi:glycoside hydrolase family 25 protein [Pseudolactococcus hodotermopsidis]
MRKHLNPVGAVLTFILLVSFAMLLIVLNINNVNQKPFLVANQAVIKVDRTDGIDIEKPIIDISGWQLPSEMDYDEISKQVNGVIVRVQHGLSMKNENSAAYKNGKDKAMDTHIQEFQKRNVPVAVYAYIDGSSETEMRKEAQKFYERASKYNPTYWWLDVEEVTMKKNFNAGIEAFRDELEKLGAKNIGIYTQDWFITDNNLDVKPFSAVWMAHYGGDTGFWNSSPDTTIHYVLHQYTSHGMLNGFEHNLDMNRVTNVADYNLIFNHGQLVK